MGGPEGDGEPTGEDDREAVVDYPPDPPAVETLKGVVRTAQLGVFLVLVLTPLLAGFVVPLGPPAYHVEVAAVNPADSASPGEARSYEALDEASRAVFDRVLADEDNAVTVRTGDPPAILADGQVTVVRDDLAFRITVERRAPPLRFPAILAGLVVATLATVAGYRFTEWDPV